MHDVGKWIISGIAASALVTTVLTDAVASHPPLQRAAAQGHANIQGNTNLSGTLKVSRNIQVKKNAYFRGKAEVDKGLLVKGGLKADTFSADSGTISGALSVGKGLSADVLQGNTLQVQAAGTVGGTLTAGALSTTGNLTAGQTTVGSLTDTGALTAASANLGGLVVTGTVDFSHANVTGLSQGSSFTSLTVGGVSATTPPLTIVENGQSSTIGVANGNLVLGGSAANNVSTAGNLSVGGNLAVTGNLSVTGSTSLNVSSLTAPNATGTTTPGQFTLTGNPIVLTGAVQATSSLTVAGTTTFNGNATVASGNDLNLPFTAASGTTAANTAHIVAAGNRDVAGTVTVTVPANTGAGTDVQSVVNFVRNYATAPLVVVTPITDPNPGANTQPKYWVTTNSSGGATTGFVLHYTSQNSVANPVTVTFSYHVIGG